MSNKTEYWRNKANALAKELKASKRTRIDFLRTIESRAWAIQYHLREMDFGTARLCADLLEEEARKEAERLGQKEERQ